MNIQAEIILDKLRPLREQGLPEMYNDSEYAKLVMSFGVNEAEWHQLQEAYNDYLVRGKNMLKEGDLNEAARILEKAILIRPNELDGLSALSEAYLRLWQQNPDVAYYSDNSLALVQRCLHISPEHEASQTRLAVLRPQVRIASAKSSTVILIFAIGLALAFIGAGLILFLAYKIAAPSAGSHFH